MKTPIQWINTRDKPALLLVMLKEFSGGSHISFEGELSHVDFTAIDGVSTEETQALKRQTISPIQDFMVVPLTIETSKTIWLELSEKDHLVNEGIIHVQIESKGKLVFGGYDNFHRDCVIAYPGVRIQLLQELKEKGIIRSYVQGNI